jgi:hypothetical protein
MHTILSTLASTYPSDAPLQFLSINAEDLPDISENYDVTAVPYLVLLRNGKTLETVSGSDASKVRAAVEKHAGGASGGKSAVPKALSADPSVAPAPRRDEEAKENGSVVNGSATKDLSGYAPKEEEASAGSKEELNTRLANLVKAAPVSWALKDMRQGMRRVMCFESGLLT